MPLEARTMLPLAKFSIKRSDGTEIQAFVECEGGYKALAHDFLDLKTSGKTLKMIQAPNKEVSVVYNGKKVIFKTDGKIVQGRNRSEGA